MARLMTAGAETKDATLEGVLLNLGSVAATYDTTTRRSGAVSWQLTATVAVLAVIGDSRSFSAGTGYYLRAYIQFDAGALAPASRYGLMRIGAGYQVSVDTDGTLILLAPDLTTQIGSPSSVLSAGQWYRIELYSQIGSGSSDDSGELRINGVTVASETNATRATSAGTGTSIGFMSSTGAVCTLNVDDIALNDSSGGSQTSWPGSANVVLLLPISDNARATLWTGGVGGTSNLFEAVNNTPPTGTASETDSTQIEHAGGAAGTTDAYDANMTSYATAGMAAPDTVNLIDYMIACGEDIATGTKLLNFSLVSNPTSASGLANFDVFPASGALGTYPSNWTIKHNTIVYAPSVTVGTSPVMRVVRPETASRVASVCFMGMYVEFVPGKGPYVNPYPQLLAH